MDRVIQLKSKFFKFNAQRNTIYYFLYMYLYLLQYVFYTVSVTKNRKNGISM